MSIHSNLQKYSACFFDPPAPSLNADTHAPSPHKKRIRLLLPHQHCGCGIAIKLFVYFRTLQSLSLSPLFSCVAVEKLHTDIRAPQWSTEPSLFSPARHGISCSMCVSASCYTLRSYPIVNFQMNKTNTHEQQMPHVLFSHTIDSLPHLSSRVARLRTNKKVKANLGGFGSHGFGDATT